jgi:ssDNA-binding Zn-finger/Zn-ribbon topoisomerase 1
MATVEAALNIELNILCPNCDEYINMMDIERLNNEGELVEAVCPSDEYWSEAHRNFERRIDCPECKKEIHVRGIQW